MPSIIADLYKNNELRTKFSDVSKYNMPMHDEIDPALKQSSDYCMQVTKAGFSALMRDRSALPGSAYEHMQVLRDYGSGNQAEDYYINLLKRNQPSSKKTMTVGYDTDGVWTDTKEAQRKGLENISTQIVSVATNLKNALQGMFSNYQTTAFAQSVDSGSIEVEEKKMYGVLFDTQNADFLRSMREKYGISLEEDNHFPEDVTLEELQVYKDMGGFRSEWSIAIEELVNYTLKESKWPMHIKRKWVDDVIDLNLIAGICKYDSETGEERLGYLNPENVTAQYSIEQNFDDSDYKGYFTLEKISKLIQKGFNKEELIGAAKRYEYFFGNTRGINWKHVEGSNFFDDQLQNYLVPVFHFYWIDCDVKRQLKTFNKYRIVVNDLEFDAEVKPLSDYRKKQGIEQEEIQTRIRRGYQCSWIVDTDLRYDCGLIPNQARENQKKEPVLPIFIWRGVNTNLNLLFGSVIESIIPFLDNLQLAWLKYQDALVKSTPGGYLINLRLLQNLKMGSREIDPIEAFEMFWKTGRMPYMDTPLGENYKGGAVLPMTRIEGDMGELMAVTANEIHFNLTMIEKMTGINPAPLGQTPDPNQPVTSINLASAGTNNVIAPYMEAIMNMKERMCDYTARRIQLLIRNSEQSRKTYSLIIGERAVRMLKDMERLGSDYGMYMEVRPDSQEIETLVRAAEEALSPGRDGKIQINLSQYMYIIEQIRSGGNLKKLTRDLSFMIRRNEKEQARVAQANVRAQAEQQAQMKQQETQTDLVKKKADTDSQITIDNNQAKNSEREKMLEANLEYKKMLFEARLELMKNGTEQQPATV
jgi:hypothetical protein